MKTEIIFASDEDSTEIQMYRKALASDLEGQRYLWFSDKCKHAHRIEESVYEDDDKLCWTYTTWGLKWGSNGIYQKQKGKIGLTYDKTKKTVLIWFRKNIRDLDLKRFFKYLNLDWVSDMNTDLKSIVTKTLLAKIISGKITNPRDLVKAYLKLSHRKLDVSPGIFFKYFHGRFETVPKGTLNADGRVSQWEAQKRMYAFCDMPMQYVLSILYVSKNPTETLKLFIKATAEDHHNVLFSHIEDMVREAQQLGKTIDFKWSAKRMKEEHTLMTQELMLKEIDFVGNKTIEYEQTDTLEVPNTWELISNQRRLYEEGYVQKHCVYNSYWNQIERGQYFVFHDSKNRITIGLHRITLDRAGTYADTASTRTNKWVIQQAYGYKNEIKYSDEDLEEVNKILSLPSNQKFFEDHYMATTVSKDRVHIGGGEAQMQIAEARLLHEEVDEDMPF